MLQEFNISVYWEPHARLNQKVVVALKLFVIKTVLARSPSLKSGISALLEIKTLEKIVHTANKHNNY